MAHSPHNFPTSLWDFLQQSALSLGFSGVGVAPISAMPEAIAKVEQWCSEGMHGEMTYLQKHIPLKQSPHLLLETVRSVIMVRMSYLPDAHWATNYLSSIEQPEHERALVAAYALGRDYHKVLRKKLQLLAQMLEEHVGSLQHREFVDSGPVLEVEYAQHAGLGWRGKHTLLLNRSGSWFFLGSMLCDVPYEQWQATRADRDSHCGTCTRCLDICPTQAIIAPYKLDARRCISYLTIESKGAIPVELRPLIGTRIYGCDDCQAVCPWNKFAQVMTEKDFQARHGLDSSRLLTVWGWTEETFLKNTEGTAIRRIGYEQWQRNIAIALGNVPARAEIVTALQARLEQGVSDLVAEHIVWSLQRQLGAG